jgi:hypothetical protein
VSDLDSRECYDHRTADDKLRHPLGYWIDVEEHGQVVGYVCEDGAEIMRVARTLHDLRDAAPLRYPEAASFKRERRIDDVRSPRMASADRD